MRLDLSEKVRLRPLDEDDAAELHALIEANRERLARWFAWAAEQSFEDTVGFLRRAREQVAAGNGCQLAVVCDGEIGGVVGHRGVDWRRRATSLGYWLGEEHEGRGTMTAAVRALTDQALTDWELVRVEIRAAAGNRRSRAIPERLGFRQEGVLRKAELVGDRHLDSVVYAMLAEDWPPGRGDSVG